MLVALASDHGGFQLKEKIKQKLIQQGHDIKDFGTDSEESCDYPDYAYPAAVAVANNECERGIVCCGTGIGVSIVANKVDGIRCALVHDVYSAKMTREHNDSNMLALGARVIEGKLALEIVEVWMNTKFVGGRHITRIDKIRQIEKMVKEDE